MGPPITAAIVRAGRGGIAATLRWSATALVALAFGLGVARADAPASASPPTVHFDRALSVASDGTGFPTDSPARSVALPDRWSDGPGGRPSAVWYRVGFKFAQASVPSELLAIYVEQACSNLQVLLNGQLIYSGGRMVEPVTRHCAQPHLVTLPPALLSTAGNVLDLRVIGQPTGSVGSVRRAGMLSALELGTQSTLALSHAARTAWEPAWSRGAALVMFAVGCLMLAIGWLHKREVYFTYFGSLCLGAAVLSTIAWSPDLPWDNGLTEFMLVSGWPVLLACAVQFLLSFAGLRSGAIEKVLALQWFAVPLSLVLAGGDRLFPVALVWYALLSAELLFVWGIYLATARKGRPGDYAPLLVSGTVGTLLLLHELGVQFGLFEAGAVSPAECALPLLLTYLGGRLFMMFAHALRETVADRNQLAERLAQSNAEMEARVERLVSVQVEELAAQRVARFTQQERKRIASDLHDDLGAKLLTMVHTQESARIPQLAREALEEMRLSVRGLAGRPVLLEDALADWRAEVVNRLDQAGIRARWTRPDETLELLLGARAFMQVTRILREAVSNVIKHAAARTCSVRIVIEDKTLRLRVKDDGRGISSDLRQGQGMSTMKRRAKKIEGQCLVESTPGKGTVILLTVPL